MLQRDCASRHQWGATRTEDNIMSKLAAFFQGPDTQFGIFYPRNYIVAVFATWEEAHQAWENFKKAGLRDSEVLAVTGQDVVTLAEENLRKNGLWQLLMEQVSRVMDTEVPLHDYDLELARGGASFLAVYCPSEALKDIAWQRLDGMKPIVARFYGDGGVEHLADHGAHTGHSSSVS